MKKLFTLLVVLCITNAFSQEFNTTYLRGYSSTFCANESFVFNFQSDYLYKTDKYDSKKTTIPSRKDSSDYDDNGFYFELWSPKWYLNAYGIDEYQKINKYAYKLLFDKRGGNLLYIYESNPAVGATGGKFYFTQMGFEKYCK